MRRRAVCCTLAVAMLTGAFWPRAAAGDVPPDLTLTLLTDDLQQPVALACAGDERLFVVERTGRIRIWRGGALLPTPFLDLRPIVDSRDGEQGLLGLAFHPDYRHNGQFYVAYVRDLVPPHDLR